MGVFMDLSPICPWLFNFFLLITFTLLKSINADHDDYDARKTTPPYAVKGGAHIHDIMAKSSSSPPPPPPPPSPPFEKSYNFSPFRPSIAVIVGVLTTMFSVTFLLLLYAKHCKRGNGVVGYGGNPNVPASSTARKNSGIDRSVIESLPIFRFGSLTGQKDGLECAVCLTRFEPTEVLRLLPKCKHAFHVECVDTWLDAHSTCPLCRYRVDPEDIFLVEDATTIFYQSTPPPQEALDIERRRSEPESESRTRDEMNPELRRVSGRHSSAGEKGSGFLQIVLQRPGEPECDHDHDHDPTTSFRRSLDSRSLKRKNESVAVGCFDRPRKDGLLLTEDRKKSIERRFEHRIIVSAGSVGFHQRWSDVQPSDLLYLRSEMIISDSRRYSSASGSRPSISSKSRQQQQQHQHLLPLHLNRREEETQGGSESIDGYRWSGRNVINSRCVSEITGLSRFPNRSSNYNRQQQRQRQAGVVSRWLAWISQSHPAVRSRTTDTVAQL